MAIRTRSVRYEDEGTPLAGVLAWEGSVRRRQPGILLVHGGGGLDEHALEQAQRYAAYGFAVLACDMFGEGVAGDRERVMARVLALRDDPDTMCRRAGAGLAALSSCPEVDAPLAAIGFCFGGLVVLTLARSGTELVGVISMHGSLITTRPALGGAVKAKVLVCHGALDPHVPLDTVTGFAEEMTRAGADWQLIMYGGAMHGFTHKNAVPGATPGVEYHEPTDVRSFAAARVFLAELRASNPLP